jgi:hypothetical protein
MLGTIALKTYWGRVDSFEMTRDDLERFRAYIVSESDEPIQIGDTVFRCSRGFMCFADSGVPEKFHFDESPAQIIDLIDAAFSNLSSRGSAQRAT